MKKKHCNLVNCVRKYIDIDIALFFFTFINTQPCQGPSA